MFDWNQFFVLAQELSLRDDDASKRTAISRAYYAVFHRARRLVVMEGAQLSRHGLVHDEVWDIFDACAGPRRTVARLGRLLRAARRSADYQGGMDAIVRETEQAMARAQTAMTLLDTKVR